MTAVAQKLIALCFLLILCAWRVNAGRLQYVDDKGNLHGDDIAVTPTVVMPPNVRKIHSEGTLYRVREGTDVAVIAVTTKYGCESCHKVLTDFATIAKKYVGNRDVNFGTLDAYEEADEFHSLVGEHPDFEWMVPALLIVKFDIQIMRKKPPFSFLLNDNTVRDLPLFLERLVGYDVTVVRTPEEWLARLHDPATERVSVTMFDLYAINDDREHINRVAQDERLHIFFNQIPRHLARDFEHIVAKYNPDKHPIVAYVTDGAGNIEKTIPWKPTLGGSADLRNFVAEVKRFRPGHEFDGITKITTVAPPGQCSGLVTSRRRDRVKVKVQGTNLHTGSVFYDKQLTLDVGMPFDAFPPTMPKKALEDLCEGARVTVAFPAFKHFQGDQMPFNVEKEDNIKYTFEVLSLDFDENRDM